MSYPRNAASPERIAIGPVVQISDGAVQASGVSVSVLPMGASSGAGAGTVAYENGVVVYTPTQAETDHTSVIFVAYKTGCIPVSQEVVFSSAAVVGQVDVGEVEGTDATDAIQSAATAAIVAYDPPTNTEMEARTIAAATYATASAVSGIPTAVWSYGTRTLTSLSVLVSSIAAAVWAYATRTLTQTSAQVAAALDGDTITIRRGDTLSVSITGLGDISARTKLWITAKVSRRRTDAQSVFQIEETDGLIYSNAAEAETAANGSITVTDQVAGNLTIALAADETALYSDLADGVYDIQIETASGIRTLSEGTLVVSLDVTQATE